jgi:hypothetical protein
VWSYLIQPFRHKQFELSAVGVRSSVDFADCVRSFDALTTVLINEQPLVFVQGLLGMLTIMSGRDEGLVRDINEITRSSPAREAKRRAN